MRISNQSLYSNSMRQSLLEALRNLRHAVERASRNPIYRSDGLWYVLTAGGPELVRALNHSGHETEAERLSTVISPADLSESKWAESVVRLLTEIDQLLICLPLDSKPERNKRRMFLSEAEPKIRKYLRSNPHAKRAEVAKAVGCSHGLVSESDPWQRKVKARKANRQPRMKRIGLDLALNERAIRDHNQANLNAPTKARRRGG